MALVGQDLNAQSGAVEYRRVLAPVEQGLPDQIEDGCSQLAKYRSYDELCELLGLEVPQQPESWLSRAQQQVERAGLTPRPYSPEPRLGLVR